jgi:ABC-type nitrate/sulfonate/bicarbonate transport system substrate-binding protein/PAS domain-containing protein
LQNLKLFKTASLILLFILPLLISPHLARGADSVVLQIRWDHQFQFAGYYAAQWQGYYAQANLDVEVRSAINNDGEILSATQEVAEGRADFGIGAADILIAADKGLPLVVAASIFQTSAAAFFSLEQTPLTGPSSFTKLKVARKVNDLIDVELQALLRMDGIDPKTIKPLPHRSGIDHLLDGSVDIMPGYIISTPLAGTEAGIKLRTLRPQNYGINFYGDSIFTSKNLVENKPELVTKFIKASVKGWKYALDHPQEIANRINREKKRAKRTMLSKQLNMFQAGNIQELILYPKIPLGSTNPERWRRMYQDLTLSKLTTGKLDIDHIIFDFDKREKESEESFYLTISYIISGGSLAIAIIFIGLIAKKTTSGNVLAGGFFAMILLMSSLEIGAFWTASTLSDLNTKMYKHPFMVSNHVHEANRDIISIHRHMKDVANARNQQDMDIAISRVAYEVREVHYHFNMVRSRFLGDLNKIDTARKTFNDWEPIRNEVIELIKAGYSEQAADVTKGKGAKHVALLNLHMNELSDFAKTKAAEFHKHSKKVYFESKITLFTLIGVVLFLAALISVFIIIRVKKSEGRIREGEERFRVALMNSPITVFSQDKNLRYKWVFNQGQQYASHSALGKTDAQLMLQMDVEELTQFKQTVLDSGKGKRQEFTFKLPNGETTYDLTCEPLKNHQGDIVGITGASTDITQRIAFDKLLYLTKFSFDSMFKFLMLDT